MLKVGFTATRTLTHEGRLIIRQTLEGLNIEQPENTEFTTGGADGGDKFIAHQLRAIYPEALHRIALPATFDEKWVRMFEIGEDFNYRIEVIETNSPPLKRNHTILDHSQYLVGFPKGPKEERRSGTWATIRYAKAREMPTKIVPLGDGKPKEKKARARVANPYASGEYT